MNEHVQVQLTPLGRDIHARYWRGLGMDAPAIKEDGDGWSQWQLWCFMEIFGAHFGIGMNNLPCLTMIRLDPQRIRTPQAQKSE